jgi:hypothetical protein
VRYGFLIDANEQHLRLLEITGDGLVSNLAPAVGLDRDAESALTCLLPIPLASDRTDLFVARRLETCSLFTPGTDGTYTDVARQYGLIHTAEDVAAVVPASAGPRFGLVVAGRDAEHSFWWPQPNGTFRNVATPAFALPSAPVAVFAADLDNDGTDEVLFLNRGDPNRLFRAGPTLVEAGALAAPIEMGTAAVVADLDGDGRLELLLTDHSSVRLFRAAGPDHAWLRVQPLTRFGAPARGAIVLLESADRTMIRLVPGTAAAEPVAHFGLGPDPAIDRVTVTWPDGAQHAALAPDARQVLRIPYPGG